jgi:FMN-dependent NADH-azoreductase
MKILHIDAGITPNSVSRQISAAVVDALTQAHPDAEIVRRDLQAEPIPHLDAEALGALADNPALAEFLAADVVVLGAPMYNFGIPSQLKAWFDRVMVAGRTFRYTAEGPQGLAGGKTVIIASSRGGVFSQGSPMAELDLQERYLETALRFLGVDDFAFVRAEGVALSPEHRDAALTDALERARRVVEERTEAQAA